MYPVRAVEFLKRHELGPNLALSFDFGQYAIWHLCPPYKVSNDGRYETVYPPALVESMIKAYVGADVEGFQAGRHADVMLIERKRKIYEEVLKRPDWVEIYRDKSFGIFLPKEKAQEFL